MSSAISMLETLMKTPEFSKLLDPSTEQSLHSIINGKTELSYDNCILLANLLDQSKEKAEDPEVKNWLGRMAQLFKEKANNLSNEQIIELNRKAEREIEQKDFSDAVHYLGQIVAIEEQLKDYCSLFYDQKRIGQIYLDSSDFKNASGWFKKANDTNPGDFDCLLNLSYALGMTNDFESALNYTNQALAIRKQVDVLSNKGWYLWQLGRKDEALETFDDGIAIDRNYRQIWINKAELLKEIGQFIKSIQCYDEIMHNEPGDVDILILQGNIFYSQLRDYDQADKRYRKALYYDPKNKDALFNVGLVQEQNKRYEDAIKSFNEALKVDSSFAIALYEKAWANESLGHLKEAAVCYSEFLKTNTGSSDAWFRLGYTSDLIGDYETAMNAYNRSLEIKAENAPAWNNKAFIFEETDRNQEAIECYKQALKIDASYSRSLKSLALLLNKIGRWQEALGYLKDLERLEPKDPDTWNSEGLVYYGQKQYKQALTYFRKSHKLDPVYKFAIYNIGLCHSNCGKNTAALRYFKKTTVIDPNYLFAWQKMGWIQLKLNHLKQALTAYSRVLEIDSTNKDALLEKAYIYNCSGNAKEAMVFLDKAIELDSYDTYALREKGRLLRLEGKNDDALIFVNRGLDVKPNDSGLWSEKSFILINDYPEDALKAAQQSLKYDSTNTDALEVKGAVLFDYHHEFEKAYEVFQNITKIKPNDITANLNMTEALMAVGRYEEARSKAQNLLKLQLAPQEACTMHFITFATLLLENQVEQANGELEELLDFYSKNLANQNFDWTFNGTSFYLNSIKSKYKTLLLRTIDMFKGKTELNSFRKEAKETLAS